MWGWYSDVAMKKWAKGVFSDYDRFLKKQELCLTVNPNKFAKGCQGMGSYVEFYWRYENENLTYWSIWQVLYIYIYIIQTQQSESKRLTECTPPTFVCFHGYKIEKKHQSSQWWPLDLQKLESCWIKEKTKFLFLGFCWHLAFVVFKNFQEYR